MTAEEKFSRDVAKSSSRLLYGIQGRQNWSRLYARYLILRVLEDDNIDEYLTAAEQAVLEGKIVLV